MILTLCSDVRLMKGKNVKLATGNSRKKNFHFYGCGWSSNAVNWSKEDELRISAMNKLFESMFGKDKVQYKFLQGKGTSVLDSDHPRLLFVCDHSTWEAKYKISYIQWIQSPLVQQNPLNPRWICTVYSRLVMNRAQAQNLKMMLIVALFRLRTPGPSQ